MCSALAEIMSVTITIVTTNHALDFHTQASEVPELQEGRLLELVYGLLSEEKRRVESERGPRPVEWDPSREGAVDPAFSYAFNNGWVPGTMNSSLKQSSNAVMRT
jgi:CCR4-NOT complex subunit CAF16